MKTRSIWMTALLCAGLFLVVEPSSVHARGGRRMRCCPATCYPLSDTQICPMYVWMSHGSYCSYYALGCPSGAPQNYDSTACNLTTSGCGSGNCLPMPLILIPPPGQEGYGYPTEPMVPKLDGVPRHSPKVRLDNYLTKTVKFKGKGDQVIYAQVFFAKAVPVLNTGNGISVSRGLQISDLPTGTAADIDVTQPQSGGPVITPVHGQGHAYKLTLPDASLGSAEVVIVLHYSTPGHDQ